MIKNNILENRLNAYRNGDPMPAIEKEIEDYSQYLKKPAEISKKVLIKEIGYELLNLSFVILKSIAFGYAVQSLFKYDDWTIWATTSVGFSLYVITNGIKNIFTKNKINGKS